MGTAVAWALRNGGCRLGGGSQPQADFYEGPAETGTEVPGAPGLCGETVRVGFGTKFGGADMVQGKVDLETHRAVAFHSVVRGNACV